MDTAEYAVRRARVVVLDELVRHAQFGKAPLVIALEEKSAIVPKDVRLDDEDALERRRLDLGGQCSRSCSACLNPASGTRTWLISSRERMVADWSVAVSKSMVTA